jgi:hypothetical protein
MPRSPADGSFRQRVNRLFSGTQNSTIGSLVKWFLYLIGAGDRDIAPGPEAGCKAGQETGQQATQENKS